MVFRGFWDKLEWPVVALSPMDGVTDAAFRYIVCKYSNPAFTMTEFTNVEGLSRGAVQMLIAFLYDESERPVIAQLYGVEVGSYYKATLMMCALGFDGVDINMGCPANKVAKKGSGAGLIRTPELAREIIRSCKKASKDWANGATLEEAGVPEGMIKRIAEMNVGRSVKRDQIAISVKTRVGFDKKIGAEWTKIILEEEPANISMHGRTLKQMYMGLADWEEIAKCAEVCKGSGVTLLGNGDVMSMDDARDKIRDYGVDGVLVGRATFGNPWFFGEVEPTVEDRKRVALDHCRRFAEADYAPFHNIRKHLAWYCKGFEGCRELRMKLMQTHNIEDVEKLLG